MYRRFSCNLSSTSFISCIKTDTPSQWFGYGVSCNANYHGTGIVTQSSISENDIRGYTHKIKLGGMPEIHLRTGVDSRSFSISGPGFAIACPVR